MKTLYFLKKIPASLFLIAALFINSLAVAESPTTKEKIENSIEEVVGSFSSDASFSWAKIIPQIIASAINNNPTNELSIKYKKDINFFAENAYNIYLFHDSPVHQHRVREFRNKNGNPDESLLMIEEGKYKALNPFAQISANEMWSLNLKDIEDFYSCYYSSLLLKVKWETNAEKGRRPLKIEIVDYQLKKVSIDSLGAFLDAPQINFELSDWNIPYLSDKIFRNNEENFETYFKMMQEKAPIKELQNFEAEKQAWLKSGKEIYYYFKRGSHIDFKFGTSFKESLIEFQKTGFFRIKGLLSPTFLDPQTQKERSDTVTALFTLKWSSQTNSVEVVSVEFLSFEKGLEKETPPPAKGGGGVTGNK